MTETSKSLENNAQDIVSAQKIAQKCAVISQFQSMLVEDPSNKELETYLGQLTVAVKRGIRLWGGVANIDDWLKAHDPNHGLLSEIKDIEWDWLD
ncbi:MAG: hypothetical protein UT13_C0001G0854 [Candidatus Pacebacteria bacterium GW2011_GWF2_38_9]|nr:MAG: hypothetical protein US01_C0001G0894 [candidate division TM6 bacterium GW2011_GWF2_28_16]KKQ09455.1 MAG: hypothetical protein US20_C0007G0010 [Candidatus Pacebacteria bacterium GW2011_GWF1_36_5]KKQ89206.1 MAG: hypothetical protein UT13_C0001G0854 [Candidatus Pacebacteria bacterium GW2011_GWF2_38_9]